MRRFLQMMIGIIMPDRRDFLRRLAHGVDADDEVRTASSLLGGNPRSSFFCAAFYIMPICGLDKRVGLIIMERLLFLH